MTKDLFLILKFTELECEKTTKYFDKIEMEEINTFCFCMLDRCRFSASSLELLLKNIVKNTQYEYSIGIILRSLTLDYLIILNSIEIIKNSIENNEILKNNLSLFCTKLLCNYLLMKAMK